MGQRGQSSIDYWMEKSLTPAGLRNCSYSLVESGSRQEEQDVRWEALFWHSIILCHGGCVTLLS